MRKAMIKSELEFEQLANHIPQLAWMADREGRLYWYNNRWFDYTGTALENMQGWGWKAVHHPDHVERVVERFQSCLSSGEDWEDTFPLKGVDGTYRWFFSRAFCIRDNQGAIIRWFGTNTDITERLEMEANLRASEEFTRSILESSPDCIKVLDIDGRWLSINDNGKQVMEIDDFSLCLNQPWDGFWPDNGRELTAQALRDVRAKGSAQFEGFCPTAKGTPKWWEVGLTRITNTHHEVTDRILCVSRDITERKTIELQLQTALSEAKAAHDKALSASRRKDEFLANMSHELRTPLNAIVGIGHILAKTSPLSPKQSTCIDTLQSSSASLLALINDLLDLAKIESENIDLENIPFDLSSLLEEVVSMSRVVAAQKKISLLLEWAPEVHRKYVGDPHRLRQILSNLCSNAIKFTERGGVKITATATLKSDKLSQITLQLADTGIGIAEEKIATIFEKFSQADSTITRRYGGTGLGLAISKRLAELMGGDIRVTSCEGVGSEFTLSIPLALHQGSVSGSLKQTFRSLAFGATPPVDKPALRILVVEDYEPNVLVVTSYLDIMGYHYDVASNGEVAVQKVQMQRYHAILMDIQMPGMDGIEATKQIRAWEASISRSATPIIGLTAHAFNEDRERCLNAGMNDYIAKPFTPELLQLKIETPSAFSMHSQSEQQMRVI